VVRAKYMNGGQPEAQGQASGNGHGRKKAAAEPQPVDASRATGLGRRTIR